MDPAQFTEDVDEEFLCGICTQVLNNPQSCKQGHTFCHDCITDWLKKKKTCPIGSRKLLKSQLTHVRLAENMINKMKVTCENNEVKDESKQPRKRRKVSKDSEVITGCTWTGKLQERKTHLTEECKFTPVKCSNEGCTTTALRHTIAEHEANCPCRWVSCEHCEEKFIARGMAAHIRICDHISVKCHNDCGAEVQSFSHILARPLV